MFKMTSMSGKFASKNQKWCLVDSSNPESQNVQKSIQYEQMQLFSSTKFDITFKYIH